MLASIYPGSAGSLLRSAVSSIESIVQRLEFAAAAGDAPWPLCCRLHGLDCLRQDMKSAAAGDGRAGADVYGLVVQATEAITTAVRAHDGGDLAPWRTRREDVLKLVAALRRLCEPQLEAELVVQAAAPAAPAPRRSPAVTMPAGHIDVDAGAKGEKASVPRKGRGRNKAPIEEGSPFRAAFWMHEATDLVPDDQHELRSAIDILGADPRPQDVFELLQRHGLTIMLSSVRNRVPPCWPRTPDDRLAPSWEFADYAVGITAESFARNLRRHANEIKGAPDLDRHTPAALADFKATAGHTPASPHGPTRRDIRCRTIVAGVMAVEEALARVNAAAQCGRDDPDAWDALRQTMVDRMRVPAEDVEELLASRDANTVERVAALLVKTRRRAGDDGDCDPDGRIK
jgi:hypothetical protein